MRLRIPLLASLAACSLTACSSTTTSPGTGTGAGAGSFSAVIDGTPWSSVGFSVGGIASTGGTFTITGANAAGIAMSISLVHIGAPGTYPLGVGGSVPGGSATMSAAPSSWWTALRGNSGSVVVTTVTPTRIVGTFSYTATPFAAGASGTRTVTQGQFDVTFPTAGSVTIPANAGSTVGGTMNGAPWNAATVVSVTNPSSGTLTFGASNDTHTLNVTISGFTGVGTYALGTGVIRTMQVTIPGTVSIWGGTGTASIGNVVVTSYTASRVQGTYSATLPGNLSTPGTVTLSGSFSVGIP